MTPAQLSTQRRLSVLADAKRRPESSQVSKEYQVSEMATFSNPQSISISSLFFKLIFTFKR